jgi:hypothetical protein
MNRPAAMPDMAFPIKNNTQGSDASPLAGPRQFLIASLASNSRFAASML